MESQPDGSAGGTGQTTALVLTGGGARGAYEVGVVSYIFQELARQMEARPAFHLYTGTSAGALNACTMASLAHAPVESVRQIQDYWRSITMERLIRFGFKQLRQLPELLMGRPFPLLEQRRQRRGSTRPDRAPHAPVAGVFDTRPLYRDMARRIPWYRLQDNIRQGIVRGIAVCATEVCTSQSVVFYQTHESDRYQPSRDRFRKEIPVELQVAHAMASSAIPFVFPAIQINGVCYVDGALRQNTPIHPAIRMGADRILVIGLSQAPSLRYETARLGCQRNPYPGWQFLLGRTVHAVMDGTIDSEIHRLEVINRLVSGGVERFGPTFLEQLNQLSLEHRNQGYRVIRACHIRPSVNLNDLAIQALEEAPGEVQLPGLPGRVMAKILTMDSVVDSDLSSFLLFTPTYIAKLLELGFNDAKAHQEELMRLFGNDPERSPAAGKT